MAMSMADDANANTSPFRDGSTTLQRDALKALAGHYPEGVSGGTILSDLEQRYDDSIGPGRFYPNLNALVEKGLVDKQIHGIDGRTHKFTINQQGLDHLQENVNWWCNLGLRELYQSALGSHESDGDSS